MNSDLLTADSRYESWLAAESTFFFFPPFRLNTIFVVVQPSSSCQFLHPWFRTTQHTNPKPSFVVRDVFRCESSSLDIYSLANFLKSSPNISHLGWGSRFLLELFDVLSDRTKPIRHFAVCHGVGDVPPPSYCDPVLASRPGSATTVLCSPSIVFRAPPPRRTVWPEPRETG